MDKIEPINLKESNVTKEVHQYDADGNYIRSFKNSSEAERLTRCNAKSIAKVCKGILHHTHGYQWRYEKTDHIEPLDTTKIMGSEPKKIYQYDMSGNYIQEFKDAKSAASLFEGNAISKIRRVCRGETSQAYGFLWRYYKVENLLSA